MLTTEDISGNNLLVPGAKHLLMLFYCYYYRRVPVILGEDMNYLLPVIKSVFRTTVHFRVAYYAGIIYAYRIIHLLIIY